MNGMVNALRERLARIDARTARWLLAAFVVFALFFELTARHAALDKELPRLRVAAGEAADLGVAIRDARASQAEPLAPAAFASALDALAEDKADSALPPMLLALPLSECAAIRTAEASSGRPFTTAATSASSPSRNALAMSIRASSKMLLRSFSAATSRMSGELLGEAVMVCRV